MPIPSYEDFTDKWGFNDGAECSDEDYRARGRLVRALNERLKALGRTDVRLVEYDRPGMHNSCMILALKWDGTTSDEQLLMRFLDEGGDNQFDPEGFCPEDLNGDDWDFDETLAECYYSQRPEIWIGAVPVNGLSYLGAHVRLADFEHQEVLALIEKNSLPIRGERFSPPEAAHRLIEINEFANGWQKYAHENGYSLGYDKSVISQEKDGSWSLVEAE